MDAAVVGLEETLEHYGEARAALRTLYTEIQRLNIRAEQKLALLSGVQTADRTLEASERLASRVFGRA